ncbi:MAG: GtrA family protein [Bowdeniella nasicola]|nr:GtrA family protein [Bowdeniella nasicola]
MPSSGSLLSRITRGQSLREWFTELIQFGAVGAIAYVVDTGLFNILVYGPGHIMATHPVGAKVISAVVATLVAWVGNRYWTFRHARRSTARWELAMFLLVNLGGIAVAAGCLGFSRYVLNLSGPVADNIAGNIIGVGLGTIFRYLCYRYVVFTEEPGTAGASPGAANPTLGTTPSAVITDDDAAAPHSPMRPAATPHRDSTLPECH